MGVFTALAIGSMAYSAYTQIRAGNAQARAGEQQRDVAESQAELADYNAQVAEIQAKDAIERGAEQESNFRMGVRGMVGKQRAQIAAGNIDVHYGSAVDLQADTAFMGELDALTIRNNAAREAWGFKEQGADLRRRAEIARKEGIMLEQQGREARKGAYLGAVGTLIGGSTSIYAQRMGMRGDNPTRGGPRDERFSGFPTSVGATG